MVINYNVQSLNWYPQKNIENTEIEAIFNY